MSVRRTLASLVLAAAVSLSGARLAAQEPAPHDTANHPRTVKQAATNVANETKRVAKRSAKAVKKGYKDTEAQTRRTGRHLARTVSPEERRRQEAEQRQQP